jgi:hypothetical protein
MFDQLKVPEKAYKEGVLDKEYHARLIEDMSAMCSTAGITPEYLWTSMSEYLTEEEADWVIHLKNTSGNGLLFTGKLDIPVENKMMSMAGACLRNYMDARVMPVQDVVAGAKSNKIELPSVLLIPNLCLDKGTESSLPPWQVSLLLGHLYRRLSQNLRTVVYVADLAMLGKTYGTAFKDHLTTNYHVV